jgi:hypothetical protein
MPIWRRKVLGLGLALGAAAGSTAKAAPAATSYPVMQAQDAWLDGGGRRHRMVFDSVSGNGAGDALAFARNFYTVNGKAYGIAEKEISVVIIFRHLSTPFGFTDTVWARYGAILVDRTKLNDPRTSAPPLVNLFSIELKDGTPNRGTTLGALVQLGARFAVCGSATHAIAETIAKKIDGDADAIFQELTANLVPGAVMVPAGIVALKRAQEHGYTLSSCG